MSRGKRIWVFVIVGIPLAIVLAGLIEFRRTRIPLDSETDWVVEAVDGEGNRLPASVYVMRGRTNTIFVSVGDPESDAGDRDWFSLNIEEEIVCDPGRVSDFLYLHFNHDMSLGVALNDAKMEGNWGFDFKANEVRFGNRELTVSLARKR